MNISVIIPVYNSKSYLHRAVDSLLNQTVHDFEIVLVDDGSTDGSSELCDQYERTCPNIKVARRSNGGLSAARNTGILAAHNEYILFIDADDYIDCDTIEMVESVIETHHPDCMCFGFRYVIGMDLQPDAIPALRHNELLSSEYIHSIILPPLLNLNNDKAHFIFDFAWNKVYKRSILHKFGVKFDETRRIWEDRPFVVEYLKYCQNFYCFERAFYNYVQTMGSLSTKYYSNFFDIILENYRHYTEWYAGEYDFDNQYCINYWCHSIENMMIRSLKETTQREIIREKMLHTLSNQQVQQWYARRIPLNRWERTASKLMAVKNYDEVVELYHRMMIEDERSRKRTERINKLMKYIKRIIKR